MSGRVRALFALIDFLGDGTSCSFADFFAACLRTWESPSLPSFLRFARLEGREAALKCCFLLLDSLVAACDTPFLDGGIAFPLFC